MFVALSYAKMNEVRAAKYARSQGARLRPGELRQQPLLRSDAISARRQLLHSRRQHRAAVRPHRQRRDAVERQPHRPRLDHRRSLFHQLARRRLRPCARSATTASSASTRRSATPSPSPNSRWSGAGAVIMKDTAPRSVYIGARTGPFRQDAATKSTSDACGGPKQGLMFEPRRQAAWVGTHAALPVVHRVGGIERLYFSSRDAAQPLAHRFTSSSRPIPNTAAAASRPRRCSRRVRLARSTTPA